MKNKYYDIMIAYRNALNVLEELTGIDTHSLKIYKKENYNPELINRALHYIFNKGEDYAKTLRESENPISKNTLKTLEEEIDSYSNLKINHYKQTPNTIKNKFHNEANIKDVLNDALTSFYLGILNVLKDNNKKFNDYVSDTTSLYIKQQISSQKKDFSFRE